MGRLQERGWPALDLQLLPVILPHIPQKCTDGVPRADAVPADLIKISLLLSILSGWRLCSGPGEHGETGQVF